MGFAVADLLDHVKGRCCAADVPVDEMYAVC